MEVSGLFFPFVGFVNCKATYVDSDKWQVLFRQKVDKGV